MLLKSWRRYNATSYCCYYLNSILDLGIFLALAYVCAHELVLQCEEIKATVGNITFEV